MAVFNTFTFDGENSLDYGVYITGEAVYNAPERAVEMVSIPGKNGALALDQGRFENIEVTYPAGTFGVEQAEFAGRMRAMRNMLASRYNYVRLTDSYHPDEYRLGLYKSGLEATPVAMSSAGEFDITFNCKPQRFLTSGEEPVDTSELGGEVTTDKIPYLFRRSGGENIGHDFDAEIDKIIGGTVAWNQLVANSGSVSVTVPSGHKYFSNIGGTKAIAISNGSAISATGGTDNIVDLTALFGSAEIADYVYSLEQTTTGSGIAWLKAHGFIDGSYRAYNEGSLVSVKTSEHRTVGFNQWDEEHYSVGKILHPSATEVTSNASFITCGTFANKIRVLPNTTYAVSFNGQLTSGYFACYDLNGNVVKARTWFSNQIEVPSDCSYILVSIDIGGGDYNHNICINISDPSKNGQYEPYESHSYPLDSDLELRGLFKLDANNNLYADGDVYESSGAVTRKYGYRAYQSGDESLTDAITDGTNTVYKLTTPTTETAQPYANPQVVNPLGTEEYIDTRDVPVPVGHETKYGMSQLVLTNPTEFPSKPLLEVTGAGTFWLGDTLFTITGTAGQTISIDCETGESWKNVGGIITPANGLVTLNRLDFPELDPGDTPVMYGTGITKVVVTPRWWII